jgi:hypothetical protein
MVWTVGSVLDVPGARLGNRQTHCANCQ